ncbi:MAG: hypothetical protein ACYCZP_03890 [Acidimicrobiales bacterium]
MAVGCVVAEGCVGAEGCAVAEGWVAGTTPVRAEAAAPGAVFVTTVVHLEAVATAVFVPKVVARVLKAVDVSALEVAPAPVR